MRGGIGARVAGVMYLRGGNRRPRCGRNVFCEGEMAPATRASCICEGELALSSPRLSYGLLIFNDGASDDDVAVVEGDDLARCDGVDGGMALNR